MKPSGRRLLGRVRRALSAVGKFAVVALVVVLAVDMTLVHVNDARLSVPRVKDLVPPVEGSDPQHLRVRGSVLVNRLEHVLDLPVEEYKRRRAELLATLPDYALPESVRFTSPYQVYAPVGVYPQRLDAQDALFIPEGASLSISGPGAGLTELRFQALAPGSGGRLDVAWTGQDGAESWPPLLLPAEPRFPISPKSRWYREIFRFVKPDAEPWLQGWTDYAGRATLTTSSRVRIACHGSRLGCLVSDPVFYQPDSARDRGVGLTRPTNLLVILVDTLRADAIHAGHAPRMAAFAATATEFTHALAPGNMTSPSTNAFLSCRRASQVSQLAFSYGISRDEREHYYRLLKEPGGSAGVLPSFPGRMSALGYDTAMIGNISVISEVYGVGISHGFKRQIALETDGYDTPAITRAAVQWLKASVDHPFFLYLHYNGPHAPYRAPFRDIFSTFPGPSSLRSQGDGLKWLYQAEVAYTDRYVAQVLDAINELGLSERTAVVLTADHGDQHRTHRFRGNYASEDFTGAYFDHGATLLDDEIRVPLAIKVPGWPPRVIDDYVSTLDTGPTLLEVISNKGAARGCAGSSLMPYLREGTSDLKGRLLASEGFRGRAVLFDDRYKYVRTYEPTDKRIFGPRSWLSRPSLWFVPEELFDVRSDPDEEHNLVHERSDLVERGRRHYQEVFAIQDAYELVIEAPKSRRFAAMLPTGVDVRFELGEGLVEPAVGSVAATGRDRGRWLLVLRGPELGLRLSDALKANGQLKVKIGDKQVPIRATSMRLPLTSSVRELPLEVGGRFSLLDPLGEDSAYLRRVADDGQGNRRILTGNPAFEKVLREWGYLNDN